MSNRNDTNVSNVIDGNAVLREIALERMSAVPGAGTIRDSKTGKILAEASSKHNPPGASVVKPKVKKAEPVDKVYYFMSDDDHAEIDGDLIEEELEYEQFQKKYPSLLKSKWPSPGDLDKMSDDEYTKWYGDM